VDAIVVLVGVFEGVGVLVLIGVDVLEEEVADMPMLITELTQQDMQQ